MLRRNRRLHCSQVQVSRPFSTPLAQVIRARESASAPSGVAPHDAQTMSDAGRPASASPANDNDIPSLEHALTQRALREQ